MRPMTSADWIRRGAPRLALACVVVLASLAPATRSARAEPWPDRPITLINPAQAGGSNEMVKAVVFDRVAAAIGKPIVMESRAGAGGTIAAGLVARAVPDGYTLMLALSATLTSIPATRKDLDYDPQRDFTPISTLVEFPLVLVVTKAVPARDLRQLVDAMRREPDRYNYGSWGQGSVNFLAFEQLKRQTDTHAVHIPYKGGAPLLQALVAGEVQVALTEYATLRPHLDSGAVRVLAVAARTRLPFLPGVPTLAEEGVNLAAGGYLMLVGPAGLPSPIADRLNAEVVRALAVPEARRRLEDAGNVVVGGSRDEAANRIATDLARWRKVVDDIGYQPQ